MALCVLRVLVQEKKLRFSDMIYRITIIVAVFSALGISAGYRIDAVT